MSKCVCSMSKGPVFPPVQVFYEAQELHRATGEAPPSRGCKYALNMLMQTFQVRLQAAATNTCRAMAGSQRWRAMFTPHSVQYMRLLVAR